MSLKSDCEKSGTVSHLENGIKFLQHLYLFVELASCVEKH